MPKFRVIERVYIIETYWHEIDASVAEAALKLVINGKSNVTKLATIERDPDKKSKFTVDRAYGKGVWKGDNVGDNVMDRGSQIQSLL